MSGARDKVDDQAMSEIERFGRGFTVLAYAVQFFFGGWFFYNGLNYFVEFTAAPPGSSPATRELMVGLESTGLFAVVKAAELVTGALLLANRFVPLAIAAAAPVSFAIVWVMLAINGGAVGTVVGVLTIAFTAVLAWSRIAAFLPMLAYEDLSARHSVAAPRLPRLRPLIHVVAAILGIAVPAAIELGTMAYFQSIARASQAPQEAAQLHSSKEQP
jgi:hypothetical protein